MAAVAAQISIRKRIALVAHDSKKQDLLEWAEYNRDLLAHHDLFATGTTGKLLETALNTPVVKLQSGPLGGDLQIGAKIAEGLIDFVIFSGIRSNRSRMIPTSRPCCASPWCGTSRSPATARRQTSSFSRR